MKATWEFWCAIEKLKDGIVYDDRNHFKRIRINKPIVIIFANTLPDFKCLISDRWRVWNKVGGRLHEFPWQDNELVQEFKREISGEFSSGED